jgi:hypothetical protein
MRKVIFLFISAAFFIQPLLAESFDDVPVIDVKCAARDKSNPDAHTKACGLQCQKSGFGILTQDGRFLKFDANGNTKMVELLKGTNKTDHFRVKVSGPMDGEVLKVESLSLL